MKFNTPSSVYRASCGNCASMSSTSDALTGYDISVSGIEGAKVVGEDGQEITNLTNVSKDTKFYIRIPADKVTDKVQKLTVNVKGHFNSFGGSYYQDSI